MTTPSQPEQTLQDIDAMLAASKGNRVVASQAVVAPADQRCGLIAIVGTDITMSATRFTRTNTTHWESHTLWDCQTAALEGFPEPSRFHF